MIGGSSSINAMAYVRGHRDDYDRWAADGLPQWSYADVLPYFKRQETWEGGADRYRGGDGPLSPRRARYADPLVEGWLQAGQEPGIRAPTTTTAPSRKASPTCNPPSATAAAAAPPSPTFARRCRAEPHGGDARACHRPGVLECARDRGEIRQAAGAQTVRRAPRGAFSAGGAINSPQLLMLSGIGRPGRARAAGYRRQGGAPGRRPQSRAITSASASSTRARSPVRSCA